MFFFLLEWVTWPKALTEINRGHLNKQLQTVSLTEKEAQKHTHNGMVYKTNILNINTTNKTTKWIQLQAAKHLTARKANHCYSTLNRAKLAGSPQSRKVHRLLEVYLSHIKKFKHMSKIEFECVWCQASCPHMVWRSLHFIRFPMYVYSASLPHLLHESLITSTGVIMVITLLSVF